MLGCPCRADAWCSAPASSRPLCRKLELKSKSCRRPQKDTPTRCAQHTGHPRQSYPLRQGGHLIALESHEGLSPTTSRAEPARQLSTAEHSTQHTAHPKPTLQTREVGTCTLGSLYWTGLA